MGILHVVATPIGNLEDLTPRAARILREADRVLAEDTRRTRVLMEHVDAATPLVSLHAHNEASRLPSVVAWLDAGETLALVSDAGTPLVSDPGARLVRAVLEAGHEVVAVPGASAVLTALIASGLPADQFTFLGFLPRKGRERSELLERIGKADETTILFESSPRLVRTLTELVAACGRERPAAVGRELTKAYESTFRGTLEEARVYYDQTPPRGELTIVVAPRANAPDAGNEEEASRLARELLAEGLSASRAARVVAERLKMPRNLAYRIVHSLGDS